MLTRAGLYVMGTESQTEGKLREFHLVDCNGCPDRALDRIRQIEASRR